MDIRTLRLFAEYNAITNQKMNGHLKGLSDEQWNRKFGGYFSSIRSLCDHLYICDYNWLKRFSKLRTFKYINDSLFKQDLRNGTQVVSELRDYLGKRKELDEQISRFIDEIDAGDIGKELKYVDSHGDEHNQVFGAVVLHFFNHQTHHRGMISIYLEEMNIENDFSNIMDMI